MNTDSLLDEVRNLFALLVERKIEYTLVGGIALLKYIEGRNTEDIDLIMALPALAKVPEIQIESQPMYFRRGRFGSLQLDIGLTQHPLFAEIRKNYTIEQQHDEQVIPTATAEGLLLLKLYALPSLYRQGSFARVSIYENDIAALMHAYRPDIDSLLQKLSSYLAESDLAEICGIIADIRKRLDRFSRSSGSGEQ